MNDSSFLTDDLADEGLGRDFAALTHRLVTGDDVIDPHLVVETALTALPAADAGALVLLRPDRPPFVVARSGPDADRVARLQTRLREGPLLDPRPGRGVVVVDDLATDVRWPVFGPACTATTGVRSLLSLRLPLGGGDQAAFSLYSTVRGAFDEVDVTTASVLAPFAALAIEAHLRVLDVGNLTVALETSRQIGVAVGIVMVSHRVTGDEAFALLRRASMDLNRKLHDVAEEIELTGRVPSPRDDRRRGERSTGATEDLAP